MRKSRPRGRVVVLVLQNLRLLFCTEVVKYIAQRVYVKTSHFEAQQFVTISQEVISSVQRWVYILFRIFTFVLIMNSWM